MILVDASVWIDVRRDRTGRNGWKAKADQALQALEGELLTFAANHGYGVSWVDAFFPPPEPRRRNKAGVVAPA